MSIFENTSFVFKHEKKDANDFITVSDEGSQPLCSVYFNHSWKMPQMWGNMPSNRKMRTTDVKIEGKGGVLLGEIHETPTGTMRLIRKWEIYDQKGAMKGIVVEKPKFIGSDWALESVDGNLLAVVEGDRKKSNYEIVTPDRTSQVISRSTGLDDASFRVEMMVSSIDPFLVLCYVVVLDIAKTAAVIKSRGFGF